MLQARCSSAALITQVLHNTDTLEAFSDNVVLSQFIQFPVTPQEIERRKCEFRVIAGFPE